MQLVKGEIHSTKWYLVRASFEHEVILTPPNFPWLETTRNFAQKYGTKVAINTNFFGWMTDDNINTASKALAWAVGKNKTPISADQIRRTLRGQGCIPSNIEGAYYHSGKQIKLYRNGTYSINLRSGYAPEFRLGLPQNPWHVIEGTFPLIQNGTKLKNTDTSRHPKTVFAASKSEYLLFVSDGRGNGGSKGISYPTVQDLLLSHGALFAAGLDGGESTSMIYRTQQLAHPCDKHVALATLPNPLSALGLMRKAKAERPVGLNFGLR